ncbi:MAG TPA: carbamate kinase [Longimicrobiales bacterium]|nr:carbamate kinase [Longimicrobiales bacterium]
MIAQPFSGGGRDRTVVVAVGGNALLPPGERGDIHQQFAHTRESLEPIVALAREGWRIVVVHGNGPQIGNALLRNELAKGRAEPLPLGVLVAATAGWIGYMIQQSLQNALWRAGVDRLVATVITQVLVDPDDPATREPVKPIGLAMDEEQAQATGWPVARSAAGWRRLAPSPRPLKIVERAQIRTLLEAGSIVVAAGGGGTPVYKQPELGLEGVDGVVDKDRAARVLARDIGAQVLLILTNVEGVFADFGTPAARLLGRLSVAEAETLLADADLGAGAMQPKVEAAVGFVREGGERAHIARLDQGLAAVRGEAGTAIVP